MEPIPQTVEALRDLARHGEVSIGIELHAMARRVRRIVPDLVGLSLGVVAEGVTLTMVASTDIIAGLDAVQYLDDGPCVEDIRTGEVLEVNISDLLDEDRWQLYARASAAFGIASSLSMPVVSNDRVVGGVNLYAATADAFAGLHEQIAEAVGSDPELAVRNADLSFETLKAAMETPARLQEHGDVSIALGIISAAQRIDVDAARERLRTAAVRAGITEVQAARVVRHIRSD